MFHVVSASAALQIAPEYSLQAFLSCANDLMCLKSSFLLKVGIGKSLLIDFALLMSLFSVVTILSLLAVYVPTFDSLVATFPAYFLP